MPKISSAKILEVRLSFISFPSATFIVSEYKMYFIILSCKHDISIFFCIASPAAESVEVNPSGNNHFFTKLRTVILLTSAGKNPTDCLNFCICASANFTSAYLLIFN